MTIEEVINDMLDHLAKRTCNAWYDEITKAFKVEGNPAGKNCHVSMRTYGGSVEISVLHPYGEALIEYTSDIFYFKQGDRSILKQKISERKES